MMRAQQHRNWVLGMVCGVGVTVACGFAARRDGDGAQRIGMVIGIKPEKIEYYKKLHGDAWPGVLKQISAANIRNYSIYLKQVDDKHWYLFSHFEYTGQDLESDMKRMAADPETQRWWKETDPCQKPIDKHAEGEWWSKMDRVFFHP